MSKHIIYPGDPPYPELTGDVMTDNYIRNLLRSTRSLCADLGMDLDKFDRHVEWPNLDE